MGFPTANVDVPEEICLPATGIYAGWYERPADGTRWEAAISVGRRPTFYGSEGAVLVEAYLLDFSGDLYGEEARVSFVARLRDEIAFDTTDSTDRADEPRRRDDPGEAHPAELRRCFAGVG